MTGRIIVSVAEYSALKKAAAQRASEKAEKEATAVTEERVPLLANVYKFTDNERARAEKEASEARRQVVDPEPMDQSPESASPPEEEGDDDPTQDPLVQFLPPRRRAAAAAWLLTMTSAPQNVRIGQDGLMRKNFGKGPTIGHVILLLHKRFGRGAAAGRPGGNGHGGNGHGQNKARARSPPRPPQSSSSRQLKSAPFWWDQGREEIDGPTS